MEENVYAKPTVDDNSGNKIRIIEFFGGIGAFTAAMKRLGIPYSVVDYVEIDKYAVKSYNAINDTNFEPQDICQWDKDVYADVIMHGSPCTDFSIAGRQEGGDEGSGTRSSLMYETLRIVEKIKPKFVIWENVKNVLSPKHIHNFKNYKNRLSELGYESYYQVLNAKNYGVPQNRERIFCISIREDIDKGFEFPEPFELKLRLKDVLEDKVDEKYYLSDLMLEKITYNYKENSSGMIEVANLNKGGAERWSSLNRRNSIYSDCNGLQTAETDCEWGGYKVREATKKGYAEAYPR